MRRASCLGRRASVAPSVVPPPWVHPGVVSGRSRVPRFGCVCRACAAAAAEAGGYEADVMTRGRYLNSWWVTHICMSYPVCARSYGGHASLADPRGTCTAGTCRHETWRPGPRGPRVVSRPAHRQIRLSVPARSALCWQRQPSAAPPRPPALSRQHRGAPRPVAAPLHSIPWESTRLARARPKGYTLRDCLGAYVFEEAVV